MDIKSQRILNVSKVKDCFSKVNKQWQNKQLCRWMSNQRLQSQGDGKIVEEIFSKDALSNYQSANSQYRKQIVSKLNRQFTTID